MTGLAVEMPREPSSASSPRDPAVATTLGRGINHLGPAS
jgi:hypothetical protein